jgi:hypothetical protein
VSFSTVKQGLISGFGGSGSLQAVVKQIISIKKQMILSFGSRFIFVWVFNHIGCKSGNWSIPMNGNRDICPKQARNLMKPQIQAKS